MEVLQILKPLSLDDLADLRDAGLELLQYGAVARAHGFFIFAQDVVAAASPSWRRSWAVAPDVNSSAAGGPQIGLLALPFTAGLHSGATHARPGMPVRDNVAFRVGL